MSLSAFFGRNLLHAFRVCVGAFCVVLLFGAFSTTNAFGAYSCSTTKSYTSCSSGYYYSSGSCTSCENVANSTDTRSCDYTVSISNGTLYCTGGSQTCNGHKTGGAGGTYGSSYCTGCSSYGSCSGGTCSVSCDPPYYACDNKTCLSCSKGYEARADTCTCKACSDVKKYFDQHQIDHTKTNQK